MYRIRVLVEIDCDELIQAQTVQRRLQAAMKETCAGAPYAIRGGFSAPELVSPIVEAPSIIIPAGTVGHG